MKYFIFPRGLLLFCLFAGLTQAVVSSEPGAQETERGVQTVQSAVLKESGQSWDLRSGARDLMATKDVKEEASETLSYLLFFPKNESQKTDAGFPMILFLHGMGERGSQPFDVAKIGLPALLKAKSVAETFPFLVISPQCPDGKCWSAKQLSEFLDQMLEKYPVDRNRVYVTGLSMGGFGTWALLAERPDAFAAAIPICGGCDPAKAEKLVSVPIWAFHGDADPIVPPALTRRMVEAIQQAGGTKVRSTFLMAIHHNAWDYVYCNPDVFAWLLEHERGQN